MNPFLIRSLVAGVLWGLWPLLLSRYAKGPWVMPIMAAISAIWIAGIVFAQRQVTQTKEMFLFLPMLFIPMLCGALNGAGIQQYDILLRSDDAARWVTITTIVIPCATFVLGTLVFGQESTIKQWIGLIIVVIGVYLIASK